MLLFVLDVMLRSSCTISCVVLFLYNNLCSVFLGLQVVYCCYCNVGCVVLFLYFKLCSVGFVL